MKVKIQMGQPKRLVKKASRDGTNRLKLKEGENLVRVLFGPVVVNTVFWPSLEKSEDGEVKPVMKAAKVPDRGGIFHGLSALDRKIQRAHGADKPRSTLDSKSKWNYLVIDLEDEPHEVKIAQFPKTVFEGLVELETLRDRKDPTKLRHGLIWMFDTVITKTVDPSKPAQFGTEYSVSVDVSNPWTGKVPAEWLDTDFNSLVESEAFDMEDVFTEGMIKALEETEIDLEAEGIPEDEDTIMERLQAFPIDMNAKDRRSDAPIFKHKEVFLEQLEEAGIIGDIPLINAAPDGTPQLTTGTSRKKAVDAEIVSTSVEEEDDDDDDEPEEKPKKKKKKKSKLGGKLSKLASDDDDDDSDENAGESKVKKMLLKADAAVEDDDEDEDDED